MMTLENNETKNSGFTSPGIYCIKVRGAIGKDYSRYLSDMEISAEDHPGSRPITTLYGNLKDQSALVGVLNALYDMHLPIISIKLIDQ